MKPSTRNVLIGSTTLAALVGLAALLMLFGELDSLLKPRYALTIHTDHAAGLRSGSGIELNGVPIGAVESVLPGRDAEYPVLIVALIDTEARIPAGAVPYATASLLGGAATLQLEGLPPPGEAPGAFLPADGTARLSHRIGIRLIEQIRAEFGANFGPFLELARNVNELLRPPEAGDPEAARANLRTAVANANALLEETRESVIRLRSTLERVDASAGEFQSLAASLRDDAHRVTGELLPVLEGLSELVGETRQLANAAAHGQGTVAQLLNNPDLYQSLDDAMRSLDKLLEELTLLVEQLRREGIQVNL